MLGTTIALLFVGSTVLAPQIEQTLPMEGVSASALSSTAQVFSAETLENAEGGCSRGWFSDQTTQRARLTITRGGEAVLKLSTSQTSNGRSFVPASDGRPSTTVTSQHAMVREVSWKGHVVRGDAGPGKVVIALTTQHERVSRVRGPRAVLPEEAETTAVTIELSCHLDAVALEPAPAKGPKLAQVLSCDVANTQRYTLGFGLRGPLLLRTGEPLVRHENTGYRRSDDNVVRIGHGS